MTTKPHHDAAGALADFIESIPPGVSIKVAHRKEGWTVQLESAVAGQAIGRGATLEVAMAGPVGFAAGVETL